MTLLRAGHRITIAEARDTPGGRVTLEAGLPGLGAWGRVRDHRVYQIRQRADAELYLSSPMAVEDIEGFDADGVIIATGSSWRNDGVGSTNPFPLALGEEVLTPDDVMDGQTLPIGSGPGGGLASVIVYDDDHFYMASVIAEKLALDGYHVMYVTPLPTVATWTELTLEQGRIIERLNALGIDMHVNVKMEDERIFRSGLTGAIIDMPASRLVVVGARRPNDALHLSLKARTTDRPIWAAGDCHVPGTIQAAVLSGHRTARLILGDTDERETFRRNIPAFS